MTAIEFQPLRLVRKTNLLAFGLLFCIGYAPFAQANDNPNRDTQYYTEPPSVDELARQLFPPKTRGMVVYANPKPNQANDGSANQPATQQAPAVQEKSVGFPVLFHFGKTTLVDSSKQYLDQIGQLMQKADYSDETLIIEGHTDAVGTAAYNERLSELRALSVKQYLVDTYNIDPLRLFPQGKGESLLFDRANPNARTNRRVEFLRYSAR